MSVVFVLTTTKFLPHIYWIASLCALYILIINNILISDHHCGMIKMQLYAHFGGKQIETQ